MKITFTTFCMASGPRAAAPGQIVDSAMLIAVPAESPDVFALGPHAGCAVALNDLAQGLSAQFSPGAHYRITIEPQL